MSQPTLPVDAITRALHAARSRTLEVLDPVPAPDQQRQVSELMSPLCWDLAHIGHYEELWLVRALAAASPVDPGYDDVYDAFKHPRRERARLRILDPAGARRYIADVRHRSFDVLAEIARPGHTHAAGGRPFDERLLDGALVYGMVVQHEHQHVETMLATIQLMDDFRHPHADGGRRAATAPRVPHDVLVPGGTFVMGAREVAWAYDNERPAHEVTVAPFRIDTVPVTNRAYAAFVDDGGYDDERLWTATGWDWRTSANLVGPQFWRRDTTRTWIRRRFGRDEDVPPDEPVQHVCWYEADAFARWSGARLPTEAEWELAASGADPAAANLWPFGVAPGREGGQEGAHRWAPSAAGSRPETASTAGVHQLLGDVWEWTASDFTGYPGFAAFPYREYSEVFFGNEYKVLRGGSWATHPSAVRTTFRNWDFPIRRQIFAGFRCARDA